MLNALGVVQALVVGGGKMTQAKVRKVFPNCKHLLFDVADDMKDIRQRFKNTFTQIGKTWPDSFSTLEEEAARYMALNNTVVLSVRCWGKVATKWTLLGLGVAIAGAAVVVSRMRKS